MFIPYSRRIGADGPNASCSDARRYEEEDKERRRRRRDDASLQQQRQKQEEKKEETLIASRERVLGGRSGDSRQAFTARGRGRAGREATLVRRRRKTQQTLRGPVRNGRTKKLAAAAVSLHSWPAKQQGRGGGGGRGGGR